MLMMRGRVSPPPGGACRGAASEDAALPAIPLPLGLGVSINVAEAVEDFPPFPPATVHVATARS